MKKLMVVAALIALAAPASAMTVTPKHYWVTEVFAGKLVRAHGRVHDPADATQIAQLQQELAVLNEKLRDCDLYGTTPNGEDCTQIRTQRDGDLHFVGEFQKGIHVVGTPDCHGLAPRKTGGLFWKFNCNVMRDGGERYALLVQMTGPRSFAIVKTTKIK